MAWLWVAGVAWLLLARASSRVRALGFAFLVVVGVLAFGGGKPYYLAAAYSLAFAAGAVALEAWTTGRARVLRPVLAVLMTVVALAVSPLGRPVLPVETFVRYAAALGQKPGTEERQALGRLPQFYADMQGWRAMAEAVAGVVRTLPPEDRAKACVFGQNYGEAGAIEYFARDLDLPPAISAHNSYWLWGPGPCTGEVLVVIGEPARAARRAVRRRAAGRRLPLRRLHALRERPVDLGRPRPEAADRHPLAEPQGLHLAFQPYSRADGRMWTGSSAVYLLDGRGSVARAAGECRAGAPRATRGGARRKPSCEADSVRPSIPRERYRALVDSLEEAQDLVELADRKARFALVIMGALERRRSSSSPPAPTSWTTCRPRCGRSSPSTSSCTPASPSSSSSRRSSPFGPAGSARTCRTRARVAPTTTPRACATTRTSSSGTSRPTGARGAKCGSAS